MPFLFNYFLETRAEIRKTISFFFCISHTCFRGLFACTRLHLRNSPFEKSISNFQPSTTNLNKFYWTSCLFFSSDNAKTRRWRNFVLFMNQSFLRRNSYLTQLLFFKKKVHFHSCFFDKKGEHKLCVELLEVSQTQNECMKTSIFKKATKIL